MKHPRALLLSLLIFAILLLCVSCGDAPADTTTAAKTTTVATTTAATTAATATTTAATTTVATTASIVPQKTPADIDFGRFTGALDGYTVAYESGAEEAATALATALTLPLTPYAESASRTIHLTLDADGFLPLAEGDYHIYVTEDTVHIRAGGADALTAAANAFLATVEDGVSSHSPYAHTVVLSTPPTDVMHLPNYADRTELIGGTVENALGYRAGDSIIFLLRLSTGDTPTGCGSFAYRAEADDCDLVIEGTVSGASGIFAFTVPVEMTLIPGSVRLSVDAYDAEGKLLPSIYAGTAAQPNINTEISRPSYSYVGGAIVDAASITSDVSLSSDVFTDFWLARLKALKKIDPTYAPLDGALYHNGFGIYQLDAERLTALGYNDYVSKLASFDFFEVYLMCGDDEINGRPAVGYITVPKNAAANSLPIYVRLNHYGTRDGMLSVVNGAIVLSMHPCGLPKGSFDENGRYTATDFTFVRNYGKRVYEYEDPITAEYTGMFLRNIQMLRFLTNAEYADYLEYANTNMTSLASFRTLLNAYNGEISFLYGGSNGGFQNIATAALAMMEVKGERLVNGTITEIIVGCPSMCDAVAYAGRTGRFLSIQSGGIGQNGGENIADLNILNYALFDTVHFASLLTEGKLEIIAGFGDVTSPSTGIIALYNATTIEKEMTFTQNKDHSGKDPNTMVSTYVSAPAE